MTVGMSLLRAAARQPGARYQPPKSLEESTISAVGIVWSWLDWQSHAAIELAHVVRMGRASRTDSQLMRLILDGD